jgi:hypothetical protein
VPKRIPYICLPSCFVTTFENRYLELKHPNIVKKVRLLLISLLILNGCTLGKRAG